MSFNVASTSNYGAWNDNSPAAYNSRKALPIKREDAEPLTREDVQFDLLHYLFTHDQAVFTSIDPDAHEKVTFGDLYTATLCSSSKCSKVLREKMLETPAFSTEFAKIALLTNVGRINTTMAFFPEMKTALRTYHPVPSLQKTDGNAQDAPRIKNCLKAALLPSESKTIPPSTPDEVLEKLRAGCHPPTSVVNLIFVLANHAAPLANVHFDGVLNFLDLFLSNTFFGSADRGRVFLWLLYHYLESDTGPNPFDDRYSRKHPGKAPLMRRLAPAEYRRENIDTAEEVQWGKMMSGQRQIFLRKLVTNMGGPVIKQKAPQPHFVSDTGNNVSSRTQRPQQDAWRDGPSDSAFYHYVPNTQPAAPEVHVQAPTRRPFGHRLTASEGQPRSMFQQALHLATTTDPLLDSDEEASRDELEHSRTDYARRLDVLQKMNFFRYPLAPS